MALEQLITGAIPAHVISGMLDSLLGNFTVPSARRPMDPSRRTASEDLNPVVLPEVIAPSFTPRNPRSHHLKPAELSSPWDSSFKIGNNHSSSVSAAGSWGPRTSLEAVGLGTASDENVMRFPFGRGNTYFCSQQGHR